MRMVDISTFIDYLASPFVLLFVIGTLVLLVPLLRKRKGIAYAFLRFFRGFGRWGTKERYLAAGSILAALLLFGVLFVHIANRHDLNVFFPQETAREEEAPVVLVAVDVSGSMAGRIYPSDMNPPPVSYDLARSFFPKLVESIHPSWKIGLVVFSDEVYFARFPVPFPDRDVLLRDALAEDLSSKSSFGKISSGTKIFEAVAFATDILQKEFPEAKERSIVIVSDMKYPKGKLIATLAETKLAGVALDLVIIGSPGSSAERLYEAYFGGEGNIMTVSRTDETEKAPLFAEKSFKKYPFSGQDTGGENVTGDYSRGLMVFDVILLASIGGAVFFWTLLRGTIARRIP